MFTGLVDAIGTISSIARTSAGRELRISVGYEGVVLGESIALNGACMTVYATGDGWFSIAAIETTLGRTTLGDWAVGKRVNLERAMRLGDRLGGHLVQGHVDAVARVLDVRQLGDARLVDVALPDELHELMVPHGSVAIDGVSLTVNELPAPGVVQLSLIDFTLAHTTLGDLTAGDRVHVEGDVIGKYVRRLAAPHLAGRSGAAEI